ncbi:hypothetical protein F5Y17DRAFT_461255 [Xylariaceae sp. FL0594]|nr:hypothetical protein F5Y17DRAFT_461255 [Xylariaceae sp. FL0594]
MSSSKPTPVSVTPMELAVAPLTGRLFLFADAMAIGHEDLELQNSFSKMVHKVVNDGGFPACLGYLPDPAACYAVNIVEAIILITDLREDEERGVPISTEFAGLAPLHPVAYAAIAVGDLFVSLLREWPEDEPEPDLTWLPPAPSLQVSVDLVCLVIIVWWHLEASANATPPAPPSPAGDFVFRQLLLILTVIRHSAVVGEIGEDFTED